jgi:1,2-diacylglycerol 3-alpha-glucosyltransferase
MAPLCIAKTKAYDVELFGMKVISVYEQAISDYHDAYSIEKITPLNYGYVQLVLSCQSEEGVRKVKIPDHDYFDMKLGLNTMLDKYVVNDYILLQDFYDALIKCKTRASINEYTGHEFYDYCIRRLNLSESEAMAIVEALESSKLVDDHAYAMDKADVWHAYGYNKLQIKKKLQKAGICTDYIEEALDQLEDDTEEVNALKVAKQYTHTLKDQSTSLIRKTVLNKLIRKGYSSEIAHRVSETIEIDNDEEKALEQAIQKARRLYASEKDEKKKISKIRLYCLRKGFTHLQIDEVLEHGETMD